MNILKKLFAVLSVICIFCVFAGCDACPSDTPSSEQENNSQQSEFQETDSQEGISLNYDNYRLEVFQSVTLKINGKYSETPVWSSDNETSISVNNGVVTALAEGCAVISVKVGTVTLTCNVIVAETDDVPILVFDGIDEISILTGDEYELNGYVIYKGVKYYDAELVYTVENSDIATIEGNKITANKIGETNVFVSANWRSYQNSDYLKTLLPLRVNENVSVKMETEEATLYNVKENLVKYGKTYSNNVTLKASVLKDGKAVEADKIVWQSSDESIVRVNSDGVASAVSVGVAQVTVSYKNDGYVCTSIPLEITVQKPVIDVTRFKPVLIDCFTGNDLISADDDKITYDFTSLTDSQSINGITDAVTGETIRYNQSTQAFSELNIGEAQWLIDTDLYTVKVNVICATKVIRTAQEFINLQKYGGLKNVEYRFVYSVDNEEKTVEAKNYTGYFVLANNISISRADYGDNGCLQREFYSAGYGSTQFKELPEVGFSGTFNGLGYSISGVVVGEGGMFGNVSGSGTVKNLVINNARFKKITWCTTGIIAKSICGTLENVVVDVDFENLSENSNHSNSAALAYHVEDVMLNNVYISVKNVVNGHNTVANWVTGSKNKVVNCKISTLDNPFVLAGATSALDGFELFDVELSENDVITEDAEWN